MKALEIDSASGERAVRVGEEEGVSPGVKREKAGFAERSVGENACRGLSLQMGESWLVAMRWQDVRADRLWA